MSKLMSYFNGYEVKDAKSRRDIAEEISNRYNADMELKSKLEREERERLNNDSELKGEIAVERARITSLSTLEEGSTTGDAELIDARVDYQGTTHENVGNHIRSVSSQLFDEMDDVWSGISFDWRDGYYNATNGIWVSGSELYKTSKALRFNHIPSFVTEWEDWSESGNNTCSLWNKGEYVGYYSARDNYITTPSGERADGLVFDTIYIMITTQSEKVDYTTLKTNGVLNNSDIEEIQETLTNLQNSTYTIDFNELEVEKNQAYINTDGSITEGNTHKIVKMKVGNLKSLHFTYLQALQFNDLCVCLIKDKDGNVVEYVECKSWLLEYDLTIPSGIEAGYIYINWWDGTQATPLFCNEVTVTELLKIPTQIEKDSKIGKRTFQGKKCFFFGDSIVAGYNSGDTTTENCFAKIFCDEVGANLYNYGVAASSFVGGYSMNENVITIPNKIKATDLSNADYVFICGGVNDCQIGVTETDFNNEIISLCEWLKSNVNVKIIFVLPINYSKTFSLKVADLELYRNYLKVYAKKYGFNVVDTSNYGFPIGESADETHLATLLFGDGLHPSNFGHEVYGKSLANDMSLLVDID